MIDLDEFRDRMKAEAERTKGLKNVQVNGRNLDDALKQASIELGLPVRSLEYEVLDRGGGGFAGIKRRPCIVVAYESAKAPRVSIVETDNGELDLSAYTDESVPENRDVDGILSVRLASDGAWIKVKPPVGEGVPVHFHDIVGKFQQRNLSDYDATKASEAAERADDMWIKIGEFIYNPANDALMTLEVAEEDMKAYIHVTAPGPGGADLTAADIMGFLQNNGISFGVLDKALIEFEEQPEYSNPYLVAEGKEPVHGADARVIYNFETESDRIHLKERDDGSVDYKELNKYQNVVKGQPLARKVSPEPGRDGRTVHGRYIPARDGNDIEIGLGRNVTIADNGATVVATASGHVMLKNGKITVETVLVITGHIDAKTGNVNALGSVEIKGNIEDGFSVSAQGNIEVAGYVGKANLTAGGDIAVSRGMNGGEGIEFGNISAGKTIWSSFITNSQVDAGEFVIVSAGIVNSQVTAQRKVLCKGKRAKIVGGHVRAAEEINAVILGSAGGAETILEVGYDPHAKEELEDIRGKLEVVAEERDKTDLNLQGLRNQVKSRKKKLSFQKEQLFNELRLKHNVLLSQAKSLEDELEKKQDYLESLRLNGRISASRKTLSGVIVRIRETEYKVTNNYENPCTFVLDGEFIRPVKYQDIEEDLSRRSGP